MGAACEWNWELPDWVGLEATLGAPSVVCVLSPGLGVGQVHVHPRDEQETAAATSSSAEGGNYQTGAK